jgi:hypothetical protein
MRSVQRPEIIGNAPPIDGVIRWTANVEQKVKNALRSDDSYIANIDTFPSILNWKIPIGLREPKRKATPFWQQVLHIHLVIGPIRY